MKLQAFSVCVYDQLKFLKNQSACKIQYTIIEGIIPLQIWVSSYCTKTFKTQTTAEYLINVTFK